MTDEQMRDLQRFKRGDQSAPEPDVRPVRERVLRCACGQPFTEHQFAAWCNHMATCPDVRRDA